MPWWQAPQVAGTFFGIHGGFRVGARQDQVGRVATGAGRRHRQAALQQALAVNALVVVLNDLVLASGVAHGRFLALAVAAAAQLGHVGRET